jgi:anti-sigma B factor antagonist
MDMQKQQVGDICILGWGNSHLDSSNTNDFKAQAGSCLGTSKKVVLDLTGITFIDSTGLGALLSILRTMRERNGEFRVCCPAKAIQLLFELVRLDKILDIHPTREEAITAAARL